MEKAHYTNPIYPLISILILKKRYLKFLYKLAKKELAGQLLLPTRPKGPKGSSYYYLLLLLTVNFPHLSVKPALTGKAELPHNFLLMGSVRYENDT